MSEHTLSDNLQLDPAGDLARPRLIALAVGILGLLVTAAGWFSKGPDGWVGETDFFIAYLIGWIYWLGIALGLFMICLLTNMSGGRWGIQLHKVQHEAGKTVWLFGLLGLPILYAGMEVLFPWARPEAMHDALILEKTGYLKLWMDFEGPNPEIMKTLVPGFYIRYAIYFALWLFFAFKISSLSAKFDASGDPKDREKMQKWSTAGFLTFVMIATFAGIDWLMSTDPHWFSSLYGPQMLVWQGLTALCFSVPLMIFLGNRKPLDFFIRKTHFHDYGKLMLALTMVWGYFTVSQFLIIWSGNLPEEVVWYVYRNTEGWKTFTVALAFFSFFIPFLILLQQRLKFKPKVLMNVAFGILVVRWFDYYWQVAPNLYHGEGTAVHFFNLFPFLGFGGLWIWLFLGRLSGRPLVPVEEPVIKEALADG